MMGLGPRLGRLPWHEKLRRALARGRGARLGESVVVSRRLHVVEHQDPGKVIVLSDADFGQAAYGRARPGDVIHIDVFHAVAMVDHQAVARAVREALEGLPGPAGEGPGALLMDYFDIGTATGGGRLTSSLDRMRNQSAKVAHRNHVHLAGLLPDADLQLVWRIAVAVEGAILAQGVELRRVERLGHRRGGVGPSDDSDLSRYYGDNLDSYIRGERPRRREPGSAGQAAGGAGPGGSGSGGTGSGGSGSGGTVSGGTGSGRPGSGGLDAPRRAVGQAGTGLPSAAPDQPAAGASQQEPVGPDAPSAGAAAGPGSDGGETTQPGGEPVGAEAGVAPGAGPGAAPGTVPGQEPAAGHDPMLTALDLSRRLGSPDEVKRVLEDLSREQGWAAFYQGGGNQAPFVMRQLEEAGLVRKEVRGMRLTPEGRAMLAYLRRHLRDVKLRFRKLIRRIPGRGALTVKNRRRPGRGVASPDVRYGIVRGTAPAQPGAWLGDVAVPETVSAAIRRTHLERLSRSDRAQAQPPQRLRLERKDVQLYLRASEHALHICLLIDASASMAGRRIMAAKHLARHLLVSTKDRIAVIAFQERDVRVYVPFTRDYGMVEEGLSRIQPLGLTPLAHGLTQSMELIRSSRVRRPLLLLITDGIPTVPKWSVDPLADALEAARHIKAGRIPFGCIGLQPSRRYLDHLSREAGGTLHVVDELSEETLVAIAHQERLKLAPQVR